MLQTPILFIVFNRPGTTMRVFQAIKQARPEKLYIAADGPRIDRAGELEQVELVRKIATNVDWECDVKTLFQEANLGCKMAVSSAITWFFENEPEGIILEDDCLPSPSFFLFCHELLTKYRHDSRIMAISGDNFQDGKQRGNYSYYFSIYMHVWGWASWRRAWQLYDKDMGSWPDAKERGLLSDISRQNGPFINFWGKKFDQTYAGKIDTWDFQWLYACWRHKGLTVLPNVNLVSNIGFGPASTHTSQNDSPCSNLKTFCLDFPLLHPPYIVRHVAADKYTEIYKFGFNTNTMKIIRSLIVNIKRKIVLGITSVVRRFITVFVKPVLLDIINNEIRIWGPSDRVFISPKAHMVNTLFNTNSGTITIGEYSFAGHNVSLITGTHNYNSLLDNRIKDIPASGNNILIGKGVWIGSNAVVLGPCIIHDHAVIAAGSIVKNDIPKGAIVAGNPAKYVKTISEFENTVINVS